MAQAASIDFGSALLKYDWKWSPGWSYP